MLGEGHNRVDTGLKELGLYTQSDREPLRDFAVN